MRARQLLRNFNVLNLLLTAGIAVLLLYVLLPSLTVSVSYRPPAAKTPPEETKSQAEQAPASVPSALDYALISEQNLFHPERRIPPEKKEAAPLPKPDFVLYGTLISPEVTLAYIEDLKAPQSTPGRAKRQTALRAGESMSGFVLKEVEPMKVVLMRGEERLEVYLADSQRPKVRESVTATGAPAAPGAAPPQTNQPANVGQPVPGTRRTMPAAAQSSAPTTNAPMTSGPSVQAQPQQSQSPSQEIAFPPTPEQQRGAQKLMELFKPVTR